VPLPRRLCERLASSSRLAGNRQKTLGKGATGRSLASNQCVIVGDTPKDLEAARQNEMRCILVGTGRYPIEELLYWHPDGCLADLTDTASVLSMLAGL